MTSLVHWNANVTTEIRAVVFDAVGTLMYADPPVDQVYFHAGRRHGSNVTAGDIKQRFGELLSRPDSVHVTDEQAERERWATLVSNVFVDVENTNHLFEELWAHFADAQNWSLYDDVGPAWSRLMADGLQIAVASNFDERLLGIALHLSPLNQARIFVSSKVGFVKPSTEFFDSIAAAMQMEPEQLLMVGDSRRHDLEGARASGWNAVLIDRSGTTTQDSIAALTEIPGLLSLRNE